jgi:hypothetical protein
MICEYENNFSNVADKWFIIVGSEEIDLETLFA